MARMRSGARGFFVLPGLAFGETGSLAAIFFALAGGTPLIAAASCARESFCGGGRFFAARLVVVAFCTAFADMEKA